MNASNSSISPSFSHSKLWHGADYNPEQWLEMPEIWDADVHLMSAARMSSASLGIFSWAMLEPREGEFHFDWLDAIIEKLAGNGQSIILATPSGAKPHWMARQYPEIRRVLPEHGRQAQKGRHNHCPTSPVYRAKVAEINGRLAERYGSHPQLLAWHISNEFSGDCACDLCFAAFRDWLKVRFDNDLDKLNRRYWSRFWSHSYGSWEEIDFIDRGVHGLLLDWRRFFTHQTNDFIANEVRALRAHSQAPVTTNFMGDFTGLDYAAMVPQLDFISWDAYPSWGNKDFLGDESDAACWSGFHHDLFRALKGQPFWLMECAAGQTNWAEVSKLKAPGVHRLSGLQTIAHGGDAVMYFQWRQSRGSSEKFHSAVVSHEGSAGTRTFQDVAGLGMDLEALGEVAGSKTVARIALIHDFENLWAIEGEMGPRNRDKNAPATALEFYRPLWQRGYAVDVVASTADFSPYSLVLAPMLYMLRPGVAERLTAFVRAGGTLVTTYWSAKADENDLCFLGGFPGPLREVLGLWVEETDVLHAHQRNMVNVAAPELGLTGQFEARDYCELIHLEGAQTLGSYERDFYAGWPAFTVNNFGQGQAYFVASRNEKSFQDQLLAALAKKLSLEPALSADLPLGVSAQKRVGESAEWIWVMNYDGQVKEWTLREAGLERLQDGTWQAVASGATLVLQPYDVAILRRSSRA